MRLAQVELKSVSPYSQSRMHDTPKKDKESHDAYEKRAWREKSYYNEEGFVFIPPMAFKFALMSAAAYLGEKVKGKGSKTWTQYFTSAVHIEQPLVLPIQKDELTFVDINAHSTGKRKDGSRVVRRFPIIPSWEGRLDVHVLDDTITDEIFRKVWDHAGMYIGIGRFRPANGGFNGRFEVVKIRWS